MNKTKRKILDAALLLYNQFGLSNVSQRKITEHLNISPGNLTYHFPKKEEIEETLYFELIEESDQLITLKSDVKSAHIDFMLSYGSAIYDLFYKYRFIFLDFVHLMKTNDKIANHYRVLLEQRKQQFLALFQLLIEDGLMRRPAFPNEYELMYKRIQITSDFFFSSIEITEKVILPEHKQEYLQLMRSALFPYLTSQGIELIMNPGNE